MFQLGAFTDEISQDLAHACDVCRDYGVTGAEIRGVWDTPVQGLTQRQVREIKRIVADHGMRVCSVASPFGKCELTEPAEIAKHMDILRRCADIARELDCRVVRGFVFWRRGPETPWDAMLDAYKPVPDILEEKDVILGIENEHACYVGTAGHARLFLNRLRCARVQVVWDPANHVHDPEAVHTPPFPEGYALIADDIVHVHVKDAAPGPDGAVRCVFLGAGSVDWVGQFHALQGQGYGGYVSLETHVNRRGLSKKIVSKYKRHLKGEGREAPSRASLAWLRETLDPLAQGRADGRTK